MHATKAERYAVAPKRFVASPGSLSQAEPCLSWLKLAATAEPELEPQGLCRELPR